MTIKSTIPAPADDDRSAYAGRWIALADGQIIGQGGTPEQARRASQAARYKESLKVEYVPTSQYLPFPEQLVTIKRIVPSGQVVYLVGGAVRDALLDLPVHDMDFALSGDVLAFARHVANLLGGDFYPLDKERQTGRVLLSNASGQRQVLDFAALRGPDLESDLRGRDFTINAIAVALDKPQVLLDPLGGAADFDPERLFHGEADIVSLRATLLFGLKGKIRKISASAKERCIVRCWTAAKGRTPAVYM